MLLILLGIGSLFYVIMVGVVGGISYMVHDYNTEWDDDAELFGACFGALWPLLGLPYVVSQFCLGNVQEAIGPNRRQRKEVAEATHQLELSRIKAQEAEQIERQLYPDKFAAKMVYKDGTSTCEYYDPGQ